MQELFFFCSKVYLLSHPLGRIPALHLTFVAFHKQAKTAKSNIYVVFWLCLTP